MLSGRRTPPRRMAAALLGLAALAVGVPAMVFAAPVQDLVGLATVTYKMLCTSTATDVTCNNRVGNLVARITPATGPELTLSTASQETAPLGAAAANWMTDMQQTACGHAKTVSAFVTAVGALNDSSKNKELGPVDIGPCRFTGSYVPGSLAPPVYVVLSVVLPPPSPAPTARPSAKPTAKPTGTPDPSASIEPSPSVEPSPTETLAPTVSPSAAPTAAAGPTPVVGGIETSRPAQGEPPAPTSSAPTFEQSVLGIEDVNAEPGPLGGNILLALLMLLIIGFAGELFNNTVENNYDEISGWFKKGPLGWLRRLGGKLGGEARTGLLVFLALTALVSSFVDPNFGLDLRSLGEFLGMFVGLIIVLASFKLPQMLAHKRKTGELGKLRPLPWALVIAALFVLVSRIGNLQPGYLYGIVLGAIFVKDVSDKEEGRETFYGSIWTLGAALGAWLGLIWARSLDYDPNGFGITVLSTAFAATLVAGLEATAFGLMPLRFMPGHSVYKWNRLGWALLFGLSLFGFVHLLIGPSVGYVSELDPPAFVAALGVFAAFGALSILTWGYFRFRPKQAAGVG